MKSRRKSIVCRGNSNCKGCGGMNEFGVFGELNENRCKRGREEEISQ